MTSPRQPNIQSFIHIQQRERRSAVSGQIHAQLVDGRVCVCRRVCALHARPLFPSSSTAALRRAPPQSPASRTKHRAGDAAQRHNGQRGRGMSDEKGWSWKKRGRMRGPSGRRRWRRCVDAAADGCRWRGLRCAALTLPDPSQTRPRRRPRLSWRRSGGQQQKVKTDRQRDTAGRAG